MANWIWKAKYSYFPFQNLRVSPALKYCSSPYFYLFFNIMIKKKLKRPFFIRSACIITNSIVDVFMENWLLFSENHWIQSASVTFLNFMEDRLDFGFFIKNIIFIIRLLTNHFSIIPHFGLYLIHHLHVVKKFTVVIDFVVGMQHVQNFITFIYRK